MSGSFSLKMGKGVVVSGLAQRAYDQSEIMIPTMRGIDFQGLQRPNSS